MECAESDGNCIAAYAYQEYKSQGQNQTGGQFFPYMDESDCSDSISVDIIWILI
jgi:hypothetical protein